MTTLQNNFAGMESEFAPGSIRGVRAWNLSVVRGELFGLTFPVPWGPGQNGARCYRSMSFELLLAGFHSDPPQGQHRAPEPECTCGFYAYFGGTPTYPAPVEFSPFVFGVIEAYGRVLIGTQGFRAEKARILALTSPYPPEVLRRYRNIPKFDNYDKMIAEFPPDRADSVAPPAPRTPVAFPPLRLYPTEEEPPERENL